MSKAFCKLFLGNQVKSLVAETYKRDSSILNNLRFIKMFGMTFLTTYL